MPLPSVGEEREHWGYDVINDKPVQKSAQENRIEFKELIKGLKNYIKEEREIKKEEKEWEKSLKNKNKEER